MTNLNTLPEFSASPQMSDNLLASGVVKTFAEGEMTALLKRLVW